jgi:hypothetical protein
MAGDLLGDMYSQDSCIHGLSSCPSTGATCAAGRCGRAKARLASALRVQPLGGTPTLVRPCYLMENGIGICLVDQTRLQIRFGLSPSCPSWGNSS